MSDWRSEPATDRQRAFARSLGTSIPDKATKGQASDIIDRAQAIADKGPATDNQRVAAAELGVDIPKRTTRGDAKRILRDAKRKVWDAQQEERIKKLEQIYGSRNDPPPDFILPPKANPVPIKPDRKGFIAKFLTSKSALPTGHRAKSGTFDRSYFVDDKTGGFCFPKYKHDKKYLVKIKDETPYRDLYWSHLDREEKASFSLRTFEEEQHCFDLEVDSFDTFVEKPGNQYLGDLKPIRKDLMIVEELIGSLHDGELCFLDEKTEKLLVKHGMVCKRDIVSEQDKQTLLKDLTATTLKDIARKNELKTSGSKADLLQRVIESGAEIEFDACYVASPKLMEWYDSLINGYLFEIRKNLERFHPLYHEDAWRSAEGGGFDAVDIKLDRVRRSRYWLSMMD